MLTRNKVSGRWDIGLAFLTWLVLSGSVDADVLEFRRGGTARVSVQAAGETLTASVQGTTYAFRRDDLRSRTPEPDPRNEWSERLRRAESSDAAARAEAVMWAVDHGLTEEALDLLRTSRDMSNPTPRLKRLLSALERLERPVEDPAPDRARQAFGDGFRQARGVHVLLYHQHDEAEAKARTELLDAVIIAFYLTFADLGIELDVPSTRLVSAYFARRADYQSYLKAEGAEAFLTTQGYYHPSTGFMACYDARERDETREAAAAIRTQQDNVTRLEETLRRLPRGGRIRLERPGEPVKTLDRTSARKEIDALSRDIDRIRLLTELNRLMIDLGTAAHEQVHQLVDASRLAPRFDAFPHWLHEGLAMQFEAIVGGRWAGPGEPSPLRLRDWQGFTRPPKLTDVITDAGLGQGYRKDPYAAAWALVYDLRTRTPSAFLTFLDLIRSPTRDATDRVRASFAEAVGGDLAAYERDWLRSLERLGPMKP